MSTIQKNEDGSVTLTKAEFAKLNKAYQGLYEIIDGRSSTLGDYFRKREDYMNVEKWQCWLSGEEFDRSNYG